MSSPRVPSASALRPLLILIPVIGIVAGFSVWIVGQARWAAWIWGAATVPVLLALLTEIVSSLRRGDFGLDIVAALSMLAALFFGEELAAVVVAAMYAGGQYLESFAERRARGEMTALLARAPRTAIRHRDGGLEEVDIEAIVPGDRILVRRGDTAPVDGRVASAVAVMDQSALTGEAMPVRLQSGKPVMSGATNAGEAFDLIATRRAAESTYFGIVRLVEAAQRSRAPMSRLADRFAMAFLAMTIGMAAFAWFWSADPIRAVAVLVVATPCPLILAVPVAIASGLSRAARHGILVKGGGALEMMTRVRSIVVDKTGTLTEGHARIASIEAERGYSASDIVRFAASLDQASKHVIAETIVLAAHERGLHLDLPANVVETPGAGIEGSLDGHEVVVGGPGFVASRVPSASASPKAMPRPGAVVVAVAVDGALAGHLIMVDELRPRIDELLRALKGRNLERIVLATGDRREVAEAVADGLPIDVVRSDLTPDQKVLVVLSERKNGPVMMVGDGVNDAPALAAADIGVAMGAKGAAASAEAADVVLLVDQLDRLLAAITIARRSVRIALESVYVGIGLSVAGMIAAALGYITPVEGALLQEAIDVAVILNALRALRDPVPTPGSPAPALRPRRTGAPA